VFFPPLYDAEDWLALATAIEDTATELGRKVVLEGYLPPRDPRLKHFSVTPDPGVIEVNVHPSASWPELIERGRRCMRKRVRLGWRRKSSCWMDAIPAPAAATMW
jgi:uncharacterized protein (DUF2126 family)